MKMKLVSGSCLLWLWAVGCGDFAPARSSDRQQSVAGFAEGDGNATPPEAPADQNTSTPPPTPSTPPQAWTQFGDVDETSSEEPPPPAATNWIQLSTDDSTSMASAQMYKAEGASFGRALKTHEFINYYDAPWELFDAEPWASRTDVTDDIVVGIKAQETAGALRTVPCEANEDCVNKRVTLPEIEVLFQMRADPIAQASRRAWNLFLCVDVSGSMEGEKIAFARDSLATMLSHFQEGDRLTLVTFDSDAHDVFVDLEFEANEPAIRAAFAALDAGSATNMIAGLRRAYDLAQDYFDAEALRRVLVFSDGDANVGDTDIATFGRLTRINSQEGIYLSGVGVGYGYDWQRMDKLTDAGKGAHIFLPNAEEVDLMFGDYFGKLMEVSADEISIAMTLPEGVTLSGFSGEEVSTNPNQRLQNIVLASGDDLTFLARFTITRTEAWDEPAQLELSLRPLGTGEVLERTVEFASLRALLQEPGPLFARTSLVQEFAEIATGTSATSPAVLGETIAAIEDADWGLVEIGALLTNVR